MMGFRDWSTGDLPTAAEWDQLQRHGINDFTSTALRDSGIIAANRQDGMVTVVTTDGELWIWNADITPSGEWIRFGRYKGWGTYTPALTASTTNPTLGTGSTALGKWSKFGTDAK